MRVSRRKVDIKPYTKNAKKHPDAQLKQIASSLKSFGWRQPIVVDKDNTIIVGHGRWLAYQKYPEGIKEPWIVKADDLTPTEVKAYRLADNKTNESDWDMALAIEELKELNQEGYDITLTGFDKDLLIEADEKDDIIPENAPTVAKLGDIWQLGRHRVMCGDSTKKDDVARLMGDKKADMVFTDPPYGISFVDTKGNEIKNDDLNDEKLAEFNILWQESADLASKGDCFLLAWQSPRKFHLLNYFGKWRFFRLITMYKSNRISFPHGAWINKTEPCCVFAKGEPRITKQEYMDDCYVYKHDKESHEDSNVGHPTPKPVKMVMSNIIACAKKDDLILDLFLGSGSTLIASEKTGRICYGMELDPKYCDVIIKRWEDYTKQKAVKI